MTRAPDRCPGVLTMHTSADGALARIRLPGGRVTPPELTALAQIAEDHGDGFLELTSRANVQLRGINDAQAVSLAVAGAGLLPSPQHERVRNLAASALTGRIGGRADVWPIAADLDLALLADPAMTGLPGKFWFGLDDGRGDVRALGTDLTAIAIDDSRAQVMVADRPAATVPLTAVPGALVQLARRFLELRRDQWRVADLPADACDELVGLIAARTDARPSVPAVPPALPAAPTVGWFEQADDRIMLGSVVAHGRIPAQVARFIATVAAPVVLTTRREILICDLDEGVADTVLRVLAPMGLIYDANSPWVHATSCVGAPGCDKAHAPVRDDLEAVISEGLPIDDREHWVGCDRACGRPVCAHTLVTATAGGGYTRRLG